MMGGWGELPVLQESCSPELCFLCMALHTAALLLNYKDNRNTCPILRVISCLTRTKPLVRGCGLSFAFPIRFPLWMKSLLPS